MTDQERARSTALIIALQQPRLEDTPERMRIILAHDAAVLQEERERAIHAVLDVIGGIAATHRWFPTQAVLEAIHGPLMTKETACRASTGPNSERLRLR